MHPFSPRSGTHITFYALISAITQVYNLSLPLCLLLSLPAFIIYGRFRCPSYRPWAWSYTLDLADLASFGPLKIAHEASLVHSNQPSHAPDPVLLRSFLCFAQYRRPVERKHDCSLTTMLKPPSPSSPISTLDVPPTSGTVLSEGLSLYDLASIRVERESQLTEPLSTLHEQIALGESALAWLVLHKQGMTSSSTTSTHFQSCPSPDDDQEDSIIPLDRIVAWFEVERLPDGWFEDVRPRETIGLLEARRIAGKVHKDMDWIMQWKEERSKV
jgi:hypothetical protein